MNLLAKETAAEIFSDAGMTVLIGLVVVFAVLILLVFVFKLFGMVMSRVENGETSVVAPTAASAPSAPEAPVAVGNTAPVSGTLEIQNGIPDETVAAISGVVASLAPAGKQYAVRRVMKK